MNGKQTSPKEILKGLLVWKNPRGLRMTYTWRSGLGGVAPIIGESLFLLIGLFFSIYLTITLFQSKVMAASQWSTTVPFILIGIFIAYRGLGIFLNSSVFEISPEGFKSSSGPLPFLGAKAVKLSSGEITKVEWQQEAGQSSIGNQIGGHRSGYTSTYSVAVTTTQGKSEKIITNINNHEYAAAIQDELSRFLKLKG
jgi:hypothetical protein